MLTDSKYGSVLLKLKEEVSASSCTSLASRGAIRGQLCVMRTMQG